jgi:predicted nucleotide-binding protein
MATGNIFYSWQTDSNDRLNRYFIEDCLKRAIRKLNREDLSDLVIDRDTKNVPGMPDIGHTILEKIANSAVVVADLTLINPAAVRRSDERPVSNPNVLFELGYAFGTLGPQAMVGVLNTTSGKIEELPFDLRPK